MSNKGFDGFDDIIYGNTGIYGKDTPGLANALADHDHREMTPTAEGLQVAFTHDPCGMSKIAEIVWPDLVALACGIPPKVAYGSRLNQQQPSLVERYPSFAEGLGDWSLQGPGGPWMMRGLRCFTSSCPKRDIVLMLTSREVDDAVRVARVQRWIRDEAALFKWAQEAAKIHSSRAVR